MSHTTFISTCNGGSQKVYYSNEGYGLLEGERPIAAIEKCGSKYGRILISEEFVPLWESFVAKDRVKVAEVADWAANREKRDKIRATKSMTEKYRFAEEVARQIVKSVDRGDVQIVPTELCESEFQKMPGAMAGGACDKGPVTFTTGIHTYAMYTKSHDGGDGAVPKVKSAKATNELLKPAGDWKGLLANPEEGQTHLAERYGYISAKVGVTIKKGTIGNDPALDGAIIMGETDEGVDERIAPKFLPFLKVSSCNKAGKRWLIEFEVVVDEELTTAWSEYQELLEQEKAVDAAIAEKIANVQKYAELRNAAREAYKKTLADIALNEEKDEAVKKAAEDAKAAAADFATKVAEFKSRFDKPAAEEKPAGTTEPATE